MLTSLKSSILFNSAIAEDLNTLAAKVDKRLYCFAYYSPNPYPQNSDPQLLFYLSVLNLHGLLWDCGPHIIYNIIQKNNKTSSYQKILNDSKIFCRQLHALRIDLAHNNSEKFYLNALEKETIQFFFNSNKKQKKEIDWKKSCLFFSQKTECIIELIKEFIIDASKNPQLKDSWLHAIQCYYENAEYIILNVLSDRYRLKYPQNNKKSRITKKVIISWVNNANTEKNYYEQYMKECSDRVKNLLLSSSCPSPAWPLEFFAKITEDAIYF